MNCYKRSKQHKEKIMSAPLSIQHKLTKVRPPRVQITYDLHAEGGLKPKEIPFVIGVLGNFSGHKIKTTKN